MSEMADAIRALAAEKGLSEDSIRQTVENTIKAAYKKTFGTSDNCIVKFADDMSDVTVYSRKTIVDGVYDPSQEIELEEALKLSSECEIGDEIDILVDPHDFERSAVTTGKQMAHQGFNERYKDNLYNEYKDKVGQIIIGYYQRERNGNIFVDLGKVEGMLPVKFQSPRETYSKNDRIKALIVDIKKTNTGIQVILSRSDPKFVQDTIENEVPEISEGIVSVYKVVREAGYRSKIAVYSNKLDVDPVGACVGPKGVRIQAVIRELEGEKIDILKYDEDPHVFIKNALSPAEVTQVVIRDAEKKEALAIVPESSFSLAIGKQGQNVRLANRLCDWLIDVKTEEQAAELDLTESDTRKAAESLFNDAADDSYEEVSTVSQLPGVDQKIAALLKDAGIDDIEKFMAAVEDGSAIKVQGVNADDIEAINKIISENVEFEDEEEKTEDAVVESSEETQEEEGYFCPECGERITLDMTHCPKCGAEFVFEEE
ncbi:transcription termination factor NusA [Treponema sp.]|jgi:N utilization substance protein A|uniref:transcription termination factor NusA n=1 Tax=Treponema sp. TaxID=166 RepID=UPI00257CF839|nr:transcription termination factor NusA [Treponema sp.]MBE6353753.1 transcription termination/antitermination protein NusA [Treponema sp.]